MSFSMSAEKRVDLCEKKIAYENSDDKLHVHVHIHVHVHVCSKILIELMIITRLFNLTSELITLRFTCRGVEIVSQLPDILTYFHHSCPAPHTLCIQFSFNLLDIH